MGSIKRKLRRRIDNVNFLEHVRKGTFTTDMLVDQIARYNIAELPDGRNMPRFNKPLSKSGYCTKCGRRSYPFKTCRNCRETEQARRALNKMKDRGEIEECERDGIYKTYRKTETKK